MTSIWEFSLPNLQTRNGDTESSSTRANTNQRVAGKNRLKTKRYDVGKPGRNSLQPNGGLELWKKPTRPVQTKSACLPDSNEKPCYRDALYSVTIWVSVNWVSVIGFLATCRPRLGKKPRTCSASATCESQPHVRATLPAYRHEISNAKS